MLMNAVMILLKMKNNNNNNYLNKERCSLSPKVKIWHLVKLLVLLMINKLKKKISNNKIIIHIFHFNRLIVLTTHHI